MTSFYFHLLLGSTCWHGWRHLKNTCLKSTAWHDLFAVPSPSLPACSAAPPGRILDSMPSPSMPGCPAAALPIPPGRGAALEPGPKNREKKKGWQERGEQRRRWKKKKNLGESTYFFFMMTSLVSSVVAVSFSLHNPEITCKSNSVGRTKQRVNLPIDL